MAAAVAAVIDDENPERRATETGAPSTESSNRAVIHKSSPLHREVQNYIFGSFKIKPQVLLPRDASLHGVSGSIFFSFGGAHVKLKELEKRLIRAVQCHRNGIGSIPHCHLV